jgi:hypothetical protein
VRPFLRDLGEHHCFCALNFVFSEPGVSAAMITAVTSWLLPDETGTRSFTRIPQLFGSTNEITKPASSAASVLWDTETVMSK